MIYTAYTGVHKELRDYIHDRTFWAWAAGSLAALLFTFAVLSQTTTESSVEVSRPSTPSTADTTPAEQPMGSNTSIAVTTAPNNSLQGDPMRTNMLQSSSAPRIASSTVRTPASEVFIPLGGRGGGESTATAPGTTSPLPAATPVTPTAPVTPTEPVAGTPPAGSTPPTVITEPAPSTTVEVETGNTSTVIDTTITTQ